MDLKERTWSALPDELRTPEARAHFETFWAMRGDIMKNLEFSVKAATTYLKAHYKIPLDRDEVWATILSMLSESESEESAEREFQNYWDKFHESFKKPEPMAKAFLAHFRASQKAFLAHFQASKEAPSWMADYLLGPKIAPDLAQWLKDHNISLPKETKGDGNCFLYAVYQTNHLDPEEIRNLRAWTAKEMLDHPDLRGYFSGPSSMLVRSDRDEILVDWVRHVEDIEREGFYDLSAALAYAHAVQRDLVILSSRGNLKLLLHDELELRDIPTPDDVPSEAIWIYWDGAMHFEMMPYT